MRRSYALNSSKTPKNPKNVGKPPPFKKKNLNCVFRDFAGNSLPKKILPFLAADAPPKPHPFGSAARFAWKPPLDSRLVDTFGPQNPWKMKVLGYGS